MSTIFLLQKNMALSVFRVTYIINTAIASHTVEHGFKTGWQTYTLSQKHETTFSTISWTRIVCLQQFLAHLLPRVYAMDRCFYFPTTPISCTYFTLENCGNLNISKNKKYVLSNSESVKCNLFIFDHVTFIHSKSAAVYIIIFIKIGWFFAARCYASAAYAVMRCLSVCPFVRLSRSWVVSKRINMSSNFFHRRVATPF